MKNILLCSLIVISIGLAGCATGHYQLASVPGLNDRALAQNLLEQVFSIYRNYNRQQMSDIISDDLTGRSEFLNSIETSFYTATILEINTFIDDALKQGDKLSVGFKWEKKISLRNSTEPLLTVGKGRFTFRHEAGGWHLFDVKGQSPF